MLFDALRLFFGAQLSHKSRNTCVSVKTHDLRKVWITIWRKCSERSHKWLLDDDDGGGGGGGGGGDVLNVTEIEYNSKIWGFHGGNDFDDVPLGLCAI